MRRFAFLLGPVVASGVLFACEDSPATEGVVDSSDARFEAAPPSEGGPLGDGSVDAPADVFAPQTVTVNVVRGGAPAANVTVVFHDAAGNVLETKTTAADGKATSTAGVTPTMASALLGGANLRRILTWTTVELGDQLFANDLGLPASSGKFAVTLQGTFSDGGAATANASAGSCTGTAAGTGVLVELTPECARPATSSILARAINDSFDTVLAYAFKKANPVPAGTATANASVGPWLTPGKVTLTPANRPPNTNPAASLAEISDGLAFPNELFRGFDRITGKTTYDVAPGFADAYQASIRFTPPLTSGATLTVGRRVAVAANIDLDLATVLPALDSALLDAADPKRPQVDWTTVASASLASTDGGAVSIPWADARTDDKAWILIVPPSVKTVKAPAMPAAAGDWLPRGATDAGPASSFRDPEVTFVESDLLPGYAELRRDAGRILSLSSSVGIASNAVLPANGTLRATSFRTQPQ